MGVHRLQEKSRLSARAPPCYGEEQLFRAKHFKLKYFFRATYNEEKT